MICEHEFKVILFVMAHLWLFHPSRALPQLQRPGARDPNTGLCPSGYPKQVVYNETGRCYTVGSRGPCGPLMNLFSDPVNPNYGLCKCQYDGRNCVSRPLIKWPSEKRCYYAFEQGPCASGEWLMYDKNYNGECVRSSCRQAKLEGVATEENNGLAIPIETFWFLYNGTCYQTGTKEFCDNKNSTENNANNNKVVYFTADELEPQCIENPVSCSTIDETEPRIALL